MPTEILMPEFKTFRTSEDSDGWDIQYFDYSDSYLGTDGGGSKLSTPLVDYMQSQHAGQTYTKGLEWCCGNGFHSFNLMQHNIVQNVVMTDIHHVSIMMCDHNISTLSIQDRAKAYLLNSLELLPPQTFDLIYASPPWFNHNLDKYDVALDRRLLAAYDIAWDAHEEFYSRIGNYMDSDSLIVMQENADGSTQETFRSMIENNGLQIVGTHSSPVAYNDSDNTVVPIYYLEVRKN